MGSTKKKTKKVKKKVKKGLKSTMGRNTIRDDASEMQIPGEGYLLL